MKKNILTFLVLILSLSLGLSQSITKVESIAKDGEPYFLVHVNSSQPNAVVQFKETSGTSWSSVLLKNRRARIGPCSPNKRYDFRVSEQNEIISQMSLEVIEPLSDKSFIETYYFHQMGERKIVEIDQFELLIAHKEISKSGNTYFQLVDRHETVLKTYALQNNGLKQYASISLKDVPMRLDEVYFLKKRSSSRHEHIRIKKILIENTDTLLEVNIKPLLINANCEEGSNNHLEFFADIEEGIAPYEIRWTIFEGQSQYTYLHDPINEEVYLPSEVSKLIVTDRLPYGVHFFVKDACRKSGEAYVYLNCAEEKKKQNVIFFENDRGDKEKLGATQSVR